MPGTPGLCYFRGMQTLFLCEIFLSIQGESHFAGYPCAFVRLSGCNLECSFCDTRYAFGEGEELPVEEVARRALELKAPYVEVTGGEPLLQPGTPELLRLLVRGGAKVLLETNGSLPLDEVPEEVHVIMDLKTPGSGMADRNLWENLERLKGEDEVKIVLTSEEDYLWALEVIRNRIAGRCRVSLSPVVETLPPALLAEWMVRDRLDARLQLQLHRIIWPERERGV